MRVALSMLTLVPGISGGSETYARELTKGLARVGRHDYSVLAADASRPMPAEGCRRRSRRSTRLDEHGRALRGDGRRPASDRAGSGATSPMRT